jgi:propionyl-CoA carboxylase alpha chain
MIRRLLVANRGEIARRVFATCRAMGIQTVAVFADPDAGAAHVAEADLAVHLPGVAPEDTYLRGDLLIAAALRARADAIHPGYGFLSENAEFAAAVADAGLTWIGPPAKAIAAMATKLDAKALLAGMGVPVLPSFTAASQVTEFPVLVKASAGGGGRGMRVVHRRADLAAALAGARREARAAFGDGTVFCERYVRQGRHIEVQVFADRAGTVVALGERECSIQRRHQKIVEETPSPAVDEALRESLCQAAVTATRAVGYVGAGTVEFLLAPDGEFYFLEMNTRLQVEHPVTECVTGLDLVGLQLLVAAGEPLPLQRRPPARGHAIEVRLYAEDPASGWRPSVGTLRRFAVPAAIEFAVPAALVFGPAGSGPASDAGAAGAAPGVVRCDSGVRSGSVVAAAYDAMLAKVIAWAPDRAEASRLLAGALARAQLHGVATNRDLLVRLLRSAEFHSGQTDTGFLDRHPELLIPLLDSPADRAPALLAAALAGCADRRRAAAGTEPTWAGVPAGWRNVFAAPQRIGYRVGADEYRVSYALDRDGGLSRWSVEPAGDAVPGETATGDLGPVELVELAPDRVVLDVAGVRRTFRVHHAAGVSYVDELAGSLGAAELDRFPRPAAGTVEGSLVADLPGAVGRIAVAVGQPVAAGELLLTLEAMKLEHPVRAPAAGRVTEILVGPGDQVDAGAVLIVIGPDANRPTETETATATATADRTESP